MIAWQLVGSTLNENGFLADNQPSSASSPSSSGHGTTQTSKLHNIPISQEPWSTEVATRDGAFRIRWEASNNGKALGMKCLTIETDSLRTMILPSRGMGIWKSWAKSCEGNGNQALGRDSTDNNWVEFGWSSPVQGPVHPSLVPIGDPSGIGWLEGFDELLVRCGLLSNGAPEFDASGKVAYPVHGRIANLPVDSMRIEAHPELGYLDVIGVVSESRFLVYSLTLESRIRFHIGSSAMEIHDTVTNLRSTPGSMQLLYHINLGQPVLQSGSKIVAPLNRLAPRDPRAAEGIGQWDRCNGPQSGYSEQVYYGDPVCSSDHWTQAMLCNHDETLGYAVHFDKSTLPVVNFWKNTASVEDGYVVGIEPATGFPNNRSFEERNNRVVQLQGGESRTFRLKLYPRIGAQAVLESKQAIEQLQHKPCCVENLPVAGWSPSAEPNA